MAFGQSQNSFKFGLAIHTYRQIKHICFIKWLFADSTSNRHLSLSFTERYAALSLQWGHNDHDGVLIHQPHGCLLNRLFRRRSKKTSKLRVTGLCAGNSPGPVNSPHKWPVTREMFPFDDVITVAKGLTKVRDFVYAIPRGSSIAYNMQEQWWDRLLDIVNILHEQK